MVCYYGSWAVYRHGQGKFDVEDIDPGICTHIIFGFAGLSTETFEIKVLDPYNELCDNWGKCGYNRFTGLKQKNANLKALLAVGGWNEGSRSYSKMAADPAKRKAFIDSSISLLKEHHFDGLDMDWEYPTQRGGAPEDKANFVVLLRELKESLMAHGMILTAAVSAGKDTIDAAYDIPGMAQHLDLLNLMAYDMHGAWEPYTHHQSGLYAYPADTGDNAYLNVDFAVNYWINGGMPSSKIALGVPLYGRCWSLDSPVDHGYYAPANQPGRPGSFTNSPGFMGYNEICVKVEREGWIVGMVHGMQEPYTYHIPTGRIWCSYDNPSSVITKAEYAREHGLAGMMVWSIETDDFHGACHSRPFHLTKTMEETFMGSELTQPPTLPTEPITTHDPDRPTTPAPGTPAPDERCQTLGINPDPDDCTHYWLCSLDGNGGYMVTEQHCPPGTLFNPLAKICDWPESVCSLGTHYCPRNC
ncbi:chitinase-3-like protein 1 isoform X2 [Panulirus ornatus]